MLPGQAAGLNKSRCAMAEAMTKNEKYRNLQVSGLELLQTLAGFGDIIRRFYWSPDGHALVVISKAGEVVLCDREDTWRRQFETSPHMIFSVDWSADGNWLACGTDLGFVVIWEVATGRIRHTLHGHSDAVFTVSWSPGGLLSSADMRGRILIWDLGANISPKEFFGHSGGITSVDWSPDGRYLVSGGADGTINIWDVASKCIERSIRVSSTVLKLLWASDGSVIASASDDCVVMIWDSATVRPIAYLEGHTASVNDLSFSFDSRLLASRSIDGEVRIWRCDQWLRIEKFNLGSSSIKPPGLHFHPAELVLATLGERDRAVEVWHLSDSIFMGQPPVAESTQYSNAKVVIVGDQGVGKSGLSLVLSGKEFKPTLSTHGRQVSLFERREVESSAGRSELRESFLWDLAGQSDYRLTHQLHLAEVALALVVFDAQNESAIFSGVRYWVSALRQARQLAGNMAPRLKILLVSSRVDRGGIPVSRARINAFVEELGLDGYYETSAREGWGVSEVRETILRAIDWSSLPRISSPQLFYEIKEFLLKEQGLGRVVSTAGDLYRAFLQEQRLPAGAVHLRAHFDTCLGLANSHGIIERLSFGNLILLQPELLDFYASALVNAAREEPDGLGSMLEEDARNGRFRMPSQGRMPDPGQENLIMLATIEDLVRHELVLREPTDKGTFLVFPSQFTREYPETPVSWQEDVVFEFEGPVLNIYATLAVRLAHSGLFERKEMWKSGSSYVGRLGGACGIVVSEIGEARGRMLLFFATTTQPEVRFCFEEYVVVHLSRRSLPGTVRRRRIFSCPGCHTPMTDQAVKLRRGRGFDWMRCNVCDEALSIQDRAHVEGLVKVPVPEMDRAADMKRSEDVAALVLQGKIATTDFDVFLAYNAEDLEQVASVAEALKLRGINPWFDQEQIPPGRLLMNSIQKAIECSKAAAVFIGAREGGKWQLMEVRLLLERSAGQSLNIIPVLLPGVKEVPPELLFLRQFTNVCFKSRVDEVEALTLLEWGITGRHPIWTS
jgi:GTPase SAR1 family protein